MEEHPYRLDVRLSQEERDTLKDRCSHFGMTQADYLRMLINMPTEAFEESSAALADAVVVDRFAVAQLARQIRHWGYLYNQAVHALNTLAFYAKRGEADVGDLTYVFDETNGRLDEIKESTIIIARRLDSMIGAHYGIVFSETVRNASELLAVNHDNRDAESRENTAW